MEQWNKWNISAQATSVSPQATLKRPKLSAQANVKRPENRQTKPNQTKQHQTTITNYSVDVDCTDKKAIRFW